MLYFKCYICKVVLISILRVDILTSLLYLSYLFIYFCHRQKQICWLKFFSVYVGLSVVSDSLRLYELQPSRLLCPWNSPGKNTAVGSHSFSQPRDRTQVSCIAGRFFTTLATREAHVKCHKYHIFYLAIMT